MEWVATMSYGMIGLLVVLYLVLLVVPSLIALWAIADIRELFYRLCRVESLLEETKTLVYHLDVRVPKPFKAEHDFTWSGVTKAGQLPSNSPSIHFSGLSGGLEIPAQQQPVPSDLAALLGGIHESLGSLKTKKGDGDAKG